MEILNEFILKTSASFTVISFFFFCLKEHLPIICLDNNIRNNFLLKKHHRVSIKSEKCMLKGGDIVN